MQNSDDFIPNAFVDVEEEQGNDSVVIALPFDPNKIKINTRPINVELILEFLEDGGIHLDMEFQSRPSLWDSTKKSRFIESLLLNFPLPAFFFNEKEENDWEVVDGLQRINTLKNFVLDKTMALNNLEFLKNYNNCRFDELPNTLQTRIKRTTITAHVIEKGTPNEVKYNIFKRINQGGLVLTPQEIRHAINQGIASDLVADLVRWNDEKDEKGHVKQRTNYDGTVGELKPTPEGLAFGRVTDWKIKVTRMEDRDFATRFLAFYLIPYAEYEPDLDTFLNNGMAEIKKLKDEDIKALKNDFKKAMDLAYDIFGTDAFRKRYAQSDPQKPINKALFEVLSVTFSKLDEEKVRLLKERKDVFKTKLMALHNEPSGKFIRAITQGTAQKEAVLQRFEYIKKILNETLQGN